MQAAGLEGDVLAGRDRDRLHAAHSRHVAGHDVAVHLRHGGDRRGHADQAVVRLAVIDDHQIGGAVLHHRGPGPGVLDHDIAGAGASLTRRRRGGQAQHRQQYA